MHAETKIKLVNYLKNVFIFVLILLLIAVFAVNHSILFEASKGSYPRVCFRQIV